MTFATALIAHEGGWDEILLVGGPIVVIIGLLALAKRRVEHIQHDRSDQAPADPLVHGDRSHHD